MFVSLDVSSGWAAGIAIIFVLLGFVAGWAAATAYCRKQMNENSPINEDHIRELYRQIGRKPSETQVLRLMNSIKKHK